MSLTMNMIGGGSGIPGNRAVLVARIPSGSTVTATKGGVTLTPMMWVSETYPEQDIALFVFTPAQFDSVNPWTITATDGTSTASTTIFITDNKEYEVELSYFIIGYKKLAYIQTSGTQALKLDFTSMDVFGVKIEADITVLSISGNQANLLASAGALRVYYLYAYSSHLYGIASTIGGPDGNNIDSLINTPMHYVYDIDTSTRAFTVNINGTQTNIGTRATQNSTFFNVFSEDNRWFGSVRCEGIKIYSPSDHSVLLYDLAPAMRLSDSVVGMINLVDETFYTNVGTGAFAYGE